MHIEYQKNKQIFTKYITACNARTRHTNRFSKILKRKLGKKKQKFVDHLLEKTTSVVHQ